VPLLVFLGKAKEVVIRVVLLRVRLLLDIRQKQSECRTNSDQVEDNQDMNQYRSSGLITYSIITAKVRRDLSESQKKYTKNEYGKYNEVKMCSKGKHTLRRGFERRYYSIPN